MLQISFSEFRISIDFSRYRPSDDLLRHPYNIPQNFFVLSAVDWARELVRDSEPQDSESHEEHDGKHASSTDGEKDGGANGDGSTNGDGGDHKLHRGALLSDLSKLSKEISEGIEKYGTTEAENIGGNNQRMYSRTHNIKRDPIMIN
jgi:meiotically up-regulated gene 157 (Mug157) protein